MTETPSQTIEMTSKLKDMYDERGQIIRNLKLENAKMEQQVTSLTEERDKLKEKLSVRLSFTAVMENKNKVISDLEALLNKAEEELKKKWEYGEFMKSNSTSCKAQSSVFDTLKLTHSMIPSLLSSQRNGGLAIEDWKALSNAGHVLKRDAQKVVTTLEQEASASLNKSKGEEE